jgi:hypothetical protein
MAEGIEAYLAVGFQGGVNANDSRKLGLLSYSCSYSVGNFSCSIALLVACILLSKSIFLVRIST